jgi:hypothetical protein
MNLELLLVHDDISFEADLSRMEKHDTATTQEAGLIGYAGYLAIRAFDSHARIQHANSDRRTHALLEPLDVWVTGKC